MNEHRPAPPRLVLPSFRERISRVIHARPSSARRYLKRGVTPPSSLPRGRNSVSAAAMSLAQHVSSVEGTDREAEYQPSLALGRRTSRTSLSYDPIPVSDDVADRTEAIGAYEVSRARRIGWFLRSV